MGACTRNATRRLEETHGKDRIQFSETHVSSLRTTLPEKNVIWVNRENFDAYTRMHRECVQRPQTDHVIEIQFLEHAFVDAVSNSTSTFTARECDQAHKTLREIFNSISNLNVTSSSVNMKKKGPHTAALRRVASSSLRDVTLEQLARQGKARTLVEQGTWTRIETEIVKSYDASVAALDVRDRRVERLVSETQSALHILFEKTGIF